MFLCSKRFKKKIFVFSVVNCFHTVCSQLNNITIRLNAFFVAKIKKLVYCYCYLSIMEAEYSWHLGRLSDQNNCAFSIAWGDCKIHSILSKMMKICADRRVKSHAVMLPWFGRRVQEKLIVFFFAEWLYASNRYYPDFIRPDLQCYR